MMTKKKNATPNYPRLRFPGFTDPWEQCKFRDILGNSVSLEILDKHIQGCPEKQKRISDTVMLDLSPT